MLCLRPYCYSIPSVQTISLSSCSWIIKTFGILVKHPILISPSSALHLQRGETSLDGKSRKSDKILLSKMEVMIIRALQDCGGDEKSSRDHPQHWRMLTTALCRIDHMPLRLHPSCWKKHRMGQGRGKPTTGDHLWASYQLFRFHNWTDFEHKLHRSRFLSPFPF